eukprot:g21078.t2
MRDTKIQVCSIPDLISPIFFSAILSGDESLFLFNCIPGLQSTTGLSAVFEPSFVKEGITTGVVADWIIAKGLVDVFLELAELAGCYASMKGLGSYFRPGNFWDVTRSLLPILLLHYESRALQVCVILIYWMRLLEGVMLSRQIGYAFLPLHKLAAGLLPAISFTLLGFCAFSHAMYVVRTRADEWWPQTLWHSFTTLITQGLPKDPPEDQLELIVLYGSVLFFSVFVMNIFIGVISEQYASEKKQVHLAFQSLRASSCLTFLMRVSVIPCCWLTKETAALMASGSVILAFTLQVCALCYGWQLPGIFQLMAKTAALELSREEDPEHLLEKLRMVVRKSVELDTTETTLPHGTGPTLLQNRSLDLPEACPDLDFTVEQRAWIYLRASQSSLVDRTKLAGFLSSPKPHCKELLKAYTKLWESEWRMEWRSTLDIPEESAASSPGSRQSSRSGSQGPSTDVARRPRSQSRRRMSRTDWILGRLGGVSSTADDKSNGNLFVSAMRSFFANAIRMAKLEADPVQRVIEAFAEALVADAAFLSCFEASMLPEAERQTYRTPDEVLFGLAYTTLMLNTDMHNKQVAQKMWDNKKFVGAGKGCGVTGGLMAQIYKNIQGEACVGPSKAGDMAKPFTWDFEPRNVNFKLCVQAAVHPSLTGCTISMPRPEQVDLDSNGKQPGAKRISLEKDIGSFNVTLDFVKGIQTAKLPISVTLDGTQQVVSEARICLGPLLLAGSPALSPETYRPGEPARSKRLRPTHSVSATCTESVGVAGLYSLEVFVVIDKPMLTEEMMTRLMPACFRVEMLRTLPNESTLPKQCEDGWKGAVEVFVEVYPRLSSCSESLRETCPRMRSEKRPHNTSADFTEPVVWLLGFAPPHALREWLQHEGLVVEVHDRDPKQKAVAAAMLRGTTGLDNREDTTDYHLLGTVVTLRAALAVPKHFQIQEAEEQVHRKHWEATEAAASGHVYTAKTLSPSAHAGSPTKWAPKAQPHRAKVGEATGPWRNTMEEAVEDERLMAEDLEKTQRYGRIVLVCTEGSDGEVIRAVLGCMHGLNAALLGLGPEDGEFKLRELSQEEQDDPHLDLLTGFCILDGRSRFFVIEGLREGHSWPQLLEVIPRGPGAPKLLHNTSIGFGERPP